jgi:polyhydroxyalkanoate synthase
MIALVAGFALAVTPSTVHVPTADGAEVALSHYDNPGKPAVVLCHGISSNHRFWDLEPSRSLALSLWEAGFDVWNLDLRGHGDAERFASGKRQHAGWTIDDYGEEDLPAAFAYVREHAGVEQVGYVGHSMGGMVLAVYLASHPDPGVSAAVAVGSPLDFLDADRAVGTLLGLAPLAAIAPFVPSDKGGRLLGWLDRRAPLRAQDFLYNPENINAEARRLMLREVVSPLSSGEIRQFGRLRQDGVFRSDDGSKRYDELLGDVHVPMLFIAGRADRVVNPDHVYDFYEAVGSPDKEFVVASVANGFHGDYGHLDLGDGDWAAVDVYPRIIAWLQAHP